MASDDLAALIRRYKFNYANEADVQNGLARILTNAAIPYEREARLSAADRIDFLAGAVGIEVKVKDALTAVLRQLHRYAQHDQIGSLILVTNRAAHRNVPHAINGKPVDVVFIGGIF